MRSAAKELRDKPAYIVCREVKSGLNAESAERLQRCIDKALEVLTCPVAQSHSITFSIANIAKSVCKEFTGTLDRFRSTTCAKNEQTIIPQAGVLDIQPDVENARDLIAGFKVR